MWNVLFYTDFGISLPKAVNEVNRDSSYGLVKSLHSFFSWRGPCVRVWINNNNLNNYNYVLPQIIIVITISEMFTRNIKIS